MEFKKNLCNFCNNSFSTRNGLLKHQKNTLYCLRIQSLKNNDQDNKIKEKRTQSEGIRYTCNFCNSTLASKSGLKKHQETTKKCLEIQKKVQPKRSVSVSVSNVKPEIKLKKTINHLEIIKEESDTDFDSDSDCDEFFDCKSIDEFAEEKKEINQKFKKIKIPKRDRDLVWKQYSNKTIDKCYVCPDMISFDNFECGHIIAQSRGGSNKLENLKPVCGPCNKGIGSKNMDEYKKDRY